MMTDQSDEQSMALSENSAAEVPEQPAPEYSLTVLDAPTEEELAELERREHDQPDEGILQRENGASEAKSRDIKGVDPAREAERATDRDIDLRSTALRAATDITPKTGNVASLLKNAQSIADWLRDGKTE